jgi:hypothetical protein
MCSRNSTCQAGIMSSGIDPVSRGKTNRGIPPDASVRLSATPPSLSNSHMYVIHQRESVSGLRARLTKVLDGSISGLRAHGTLKVKMASFSQYPLWREQPTHREASAAAGTQSDLKNSQTG